MYICTSSITVLEVPVLLYIVPGTPPVLLYIVPGTAVPVQVYFKYFEYM